MASLITQTVGGLKCDSPNCDFRDDSIKREDYESCVGMPCPECGASLLTEHDYEFMLELERTVGYLNTLAGELPEQEADFQLEVNLNGSGVPAFEVREM
jgi:hypothetical protein